MSRLASASAMASARPAQAPSNWGPQGERSSLTPSTETTATNRAIAGLLVVISTP